MDVSLLIRQRLSELELDQKDLAVAAQVTESYISQLLARKKAPPAPGRTDLYEKIGQFLKLPAGELARLAEVQRQQELKKKVSEAPSPLFKDCREFILRTCEANHRAEVRRIFEKEPFGELERLVTQTILEVAQGVAREELRNEAWLRATAKLSGRSYEEMRVAILEFLDTEAFHVSLEGCVAFLEPAIASWGIDVRTFALEVSLKAALKGRSKVAGSRKRFMFQEQVLPNVPEMEPGLQAFLRDRSLSGDATADEVDYFRSLTFPRGRPTALYYYRELQSLRDPLHFPAAV